MDWKQALKVGGPSVVVTYVFYSFSSNYLSETELLKDSLILNITLLVIVFLFCVFVCYRVTMPKVNPTGAKKISKNSIEDNEIESSVNIGKNRNDIDITDNKVIKNKVKGDLNIG